jgi:hypothetical protein
MVLETDCAAVVSVRLVDGSMCMGWMVHVFVDGMVPIGTIPLSVWFGGFQRDGMDVCNVFSLTIC